MTEERGEGWGGGGEGRTGRRGGEREGENGRMRRGVVDNAGVLVWGGGMVGEDGKREMGERRWEDARGKETPRDPGPANLPL